MRGLHVVTGGPPRDSRAMYRRLSGVLQGTLTGGLIALGLLLLNGPSASRPGAAGRATASAAPLTSTAGSAADLSRWCPDFLRRGRTPGASLARSPNDDGNTGGSPFVYVTVIQSDGIPVPGVYANPAPAAHHPFLTVPTVTDPFAVC